MLDLLFENVFMHRDFRDRWQEICFDPFVETAAHEVMSSRNSSRSLNCVQPPAALLRCGLQIHTDQNRSKQIGFDLLVVTVGNSGVDGPLS